MKDTKNGSILTLFSQGSAGDDISADAGQELPENTDMQSEDGKFEELIKGRFKDAYAKRTQKMIDRRFRETKELEAYRDRAERLVAALSEKLGSDADIDSVESALGTLDERNRESERRLSRAKAATGAAAEYERILSDAEACRGVYPSFDLEAECRDPMFTKLISAGMPVRRAYEALHHEKLLAGAMQYAADRVAEAAQKGSALSASRPEENGTASGAPIDPKRDVSAMSRSEILSILKRVERGEKIRF